MANRDGFEVTPYVTIAYDVLALADWTAHFISSLLNGQDYFAIFVVVRVALETFNAKRKI